MEKLETLIQELYQEGTREKNMEVLSHIRKLAKEEKQFIIPVGDANGEKVYRRLSLDDGQDVFVALLLPLNHQSPSNSHVSWERNQNAPF